ncbi:hypothetical protein LC085_15250 [Bacillus tianshenii]|uniref:hypothetical protein n=1 Tax=Sutcliffiella tianshenii TaxID=1463404 RepID=UPI001CD6F026|nr:hypothetical protein [Bacillus tianshenii]MCA1321277.1 hypothetical protein [Bacillus tianshenii]
MTAEKAVIPDKYPIIFIASIKNRQSSSKGDTIFSTKTQGVSKINALVRFIINTGYL